jgi:predicted ATPase
MASTKRSRLRFTRLRLERWRNFSRVEIALARRAFFIGPNASGKSNLLDAFRFLRDLASVGGGFQAAIEARGGVSAIRSLAARNPPLVAVEVDVGTDEQPAEWTYILQFRQHPQRHVPTIEREEVRHRGRVLLQRPDRDDREDPVRLGQTHIEQINTNRDFRELADFFESLRYLHIVPQLVREPDRSIGRRNDPYGGDFLEQIASTGDKTRRARLKKITAALRVAVPQLDQLDMRQDRKGFWHLYGLYEHWRPKAGWQTEEQFSDGTLRLLGLLWALLETGGPLLLEEPELSLHPDVVRHIPGMFARMQRSSGRQVVVTTHSEALLSEKGIGLDEVHLLIPEREGTRLESGTGMDDVRELLRGGLTMGEAVLPKAKPATASQLSLFPF